MLGILCAAVVTTGAGYMIIKKYYAQTVLISAGMVLMFLAWLFNLSPAVLTAKKSLGFIGFDLFEAVHQILSTRIAGLGLSIMAIAGFAKYMDQINASQALFDLVGAPLQKIRNPYVLTVLAFIVSTFLGLFIPSTAGHAMLLMVTIYPLMIRVGVTRMSALCVIACSRLLDLGPGSGNAIMAAVTAGMDVGVYFFEWQGRIAIPVVAVVSVVLYFMLPWMDKRDGEDTEGREQLEALEAKAASSPKLPKIYALLPCLPLFFILGFSPVITKPLGIKVKMSVVAAMMISTVLAMLFEYIRLRDGRKVINSLKVFFDGMGIQFVVVVSLIISGETFAKGLTDIGAVSTLINSAKEAGFGLRAMIFSTCFIITLFAFLMGSGNAPFFSFAALGPGITKALGVEPIILLMPMEFASSIGRTMSPVTGALVAISGIAGVSPFQVVRRTFIPCITTFIVQLIAMELFVIPKGF